MECQVLFSLKVYIYNRASRPVIATIEEVNKLKASVLILIICTKFIALFVQLCMNKYV